ncbi:holo-ACP synthase [Aquitalea sp. S1-19]|uniref:Holo-[acyl-carrier-protein] synthase n=1 Tax=Craterilacuibacter sinensis TaxID=2686017 RepID=A0A845BNP9_9NEIS|nr:holo-ACP synthase [Craterilacuibacter sinensis]MCP9760358.1 holo-ACP synthase [Aquitalea sp. S1-19]MXR36808.1 holo-ACP synthase [Craterilacuibacter sinensis]RQW29219.1 holo-ACP synthase [Rhodobacteraceae bacterium CH30]
MICGVGTDLAEIARFEAMIARRGLGVGRRLLSASELADFAASSDPARFLAKRFAAKEALAKALGTGVRAPVLLTAIAVGHDALGKPQFALSAELSAFVAARGISHLHLSISDERTQALAFVVAESRS